MQSTLDPKRFASACCAVCGRDAPPYTKREDGTDRCSACADAPGIQSVHTPLDEAMGTLKDGAEWRALTLRFLFPTEPPDPGWVRMYAAPDLSALERLRHADLCEQVRVEALARFRSGEWEGWGHWLSGPRLTRIPAWLWRRRGVELCPVINGEMQFGAVRWRGGAARYFDQISVVEHPLPAEPALPTGRRGPMGRAAASVRAAMLAWVSDGKGTADELRTLPKKQLPGLFGAGETTCFNARMAVLETLTKKL